MWPGHASAIWIKLAIFDAALADCTCPATTPPGARVVRHRADRTATLRRRIPRVAVRFSGRMNRGHSNLNHRTSVGEGSHSAEGCCSCSPDSIRKAGGSRIGRSVGAVGWRFGCRTHRGGSRHRCMDRRIVKHKTGRLNFTPSRPCSYQACST